MADEGWWIVQTTVLPVSATVRMLRTKACAANESKPVVGSSKKRMEGFAASSVPIETRFRCSKLNPPVLISPI